MAGQLWKLYCSQFIKVPININGEKSINRLLLRFFSPVLVRPNRIRKVVSLVPAADFLLFIFSPPCCWCCFVSWLARNGSHLSHFILVWTLEICQVINHRAGPVFTCSDRCDLEQCPISTFDRDVCKALHQGNWRRVWNKAILYMSLYFLYIYIHLCSMYF